MIYKIIYWVSNSRNWNVSSTLSNLWCLYCSWFSGFCFSLVRLTRRTVFHEKVRWSSLSSVKSCYCKYSTSLVEAHFHDFKNVFIEFWTGEDWFPVLCTFPLEWAVTQVIVKLLFLCALWSVYLCKYVISHIKSGGLISIQLLKKS